MQKIKFIFFFVLALTLINNKVSGQAYIYHPMVVDSARWEYSQIKENNVFCDGDFKKLLFGDTIVDAKLYKKIKTPGNVAFDLMREENKKIYYRRGFSSSFKQELLLYDFSKNLGDTILTGDYNAQGTIDTLKSKIIKVDSIKTQMGYRKRFKVDAINYNWVASCDMPERFWFIEEIGSPILIFYTEFVTLSGGGACEGSYYIVRKTSINDTLVLPPENCLYLSVADEKQINSDEVFFKKNTDNSKCIVKFDFNPFGELELYDLSGKRIYVLKCDTRMEYNLEILLDNNIYMWKYYDSKRNKYLSGKFSFN